ncbi:MAG: hypothetical protein KIT36_12260 [Alphaproteobacteria bacterium]|nr:hypothetical protein [Alphaproteobacteria bacterium]
MPIAIDADSVTRMAQGLRLVRALVALCAIVAYGAPAFAHAGHRAEQSAAAAHAEQPPCAHHTAGASLVAGPAGAEHAEHQPSSAPKCPGHRDGSVWCCVAMCHAALPLADSAAAWLPQPHISSDRRIVEAVGSTFVTRLERPPKLTAAPIG